VLRDVAVDSGNKVQMKPQVLVTGEFLGKCTGVKVIRTAAVGYNNIDVCIRSGYTRPCVLRERFRGAGGSSNVRVRSSCVFARYADLRARICRFKNRRRRFPWPRPSVGPNLPPPHRAPPHVTLGPIYHGMMPLMAIQIVAMVLLYAFPQNGM
jgi:hypothetical protein